MKLSGCLLLITLLLSFSSKEKGESRTSFAQRQAESLPAGELTVNDFNVSGSDGSEIEQVDTNWFKLTLGPAPQPALPTEGLAGYPPGQDCWANWIRFEILRNAKGNAFRLDVEFPCENEPVYHFTNYAPCWSYNGREWSYIQWLKDAESGRSGTLLFPEFSEDRVIVSAQLPMTVQEAEGLIDAWKKHPHVKVHVLGKSVQGRNLYRVEITDPESEIPRSQRWVHHAGNQHPGEGIAQWYIAGMVQWFLGDEAAEALKRTIGHFTLMMNPDGVANGWCRANAQGIDMNRSFRLEGPDPELQPNEAYIFQRDFEDLMNSMAPVTTSWSMHSWGSPQMEPILMGVGAEMDRKVGSLEGFAGIVAKRDPNKLVKTPWLHPEPQPSNFWDAGPYHKYGITNWLVEGGGGQLNKRQCLEAGTILMKSITEYYAGHK